VPDGDGSDLERVAVLRRNLAALNRTLRARHGVAPLVDDDAAEALDLGQLGEAVRLTGKYLVTVARALEGYS
jgi:hypothetical protein